MIWLVGKLNPEHLDLLSQLVRLFPIRSIENLDDLSPVEPLNQLFKPTWILAIDTSGYKVSDRVEWIASHYNIDDKVIAISPNREKPSLWKVAQKSAYLTMDQLCTVLTERFTSDQSSPANSIGYKDLVLDWDLFQLRVLPSDDPIHLPLKEAQILKIFMLHPNQCWNREDLRRMVWNGTSISPRTIDSHISKLRKKLLPAQVSLENIYGDGYILS